MNEVFASLEAAGFRQIGVTTHRGEVLDYTFFNGAGVRVEIDFRHSTAPKPSSKNQYEFSVTRP